MVDIDDADKICACCGEKRQPMGEVVTERLIVIPAKVHVEKTIRPKYVCNSKKCTNEGIFIAPLVPRILPKSYASASLIADILTKGSFTVAQWEYLAKLAQIGPPNVPSQVVKKKIPDPSPQAKLIIQTEDNYTFSLGCIVKSKTNRKSPTTLKVSHLFSSDKNCHFRDFRYEL